jgi:trimeric autotransporter adhesin
MKKIILSLIAILAISPTIIAQNTFPSTGFVGIGTLTPEYPLDLQVGFEVPVIAQLGTRQLYTGNAGVGFGTGVFSNVTPSEYLFNVGIGDSALFQNQTGRYNVAVGRESLKNNLSGEYNVGVGREALKSNMTGQENVAIGSAALISNKGGSDNVALGNNALQNNRNANKNTAVGYLSMYENISGTENTALGYFSLYFNTKGNYNTAVGSSCINDNKLGSYNSALGYLVDVTANNLSNSSGVGYNAIIDASNKMVFGNSSVSSIGGQVDWTVYSDARIKEQVEENVPGLAFINRLRPVSYNYNIKTQNQLMGRIDTAQWTDKYAIQEMTFSGFIAQEVAAAAEELGYEFSGVDESGQLMGLRYATFVVPLVKAVQELSIENEGLKEAVQEINKENQYLKAENENFESRITQLEQVITKQGIVLSNATTEEIYKQSAIIENETGLATLSQNVPNPFTGNTSIAYYVPETAQQAHIKIANATGVALFMAEVRLGNGVLEVDATQLAAGTYSYTLLVDGKVVDTKLMVIQ